MSGTYTLAEIHERHEALERMAADIHQARADTTLFRLAADEPRAGFSEYFLAVVSERLDPLLDGILAVLDEELTASRAQLKRDATDAYVAFMGGE